GLSTVPFACELYGEIATPLILYFSSNHCTAFRKGAPLSVTIFTTVPHRHIISSNNHCPIDRASSFHSAFASIQDERAQRPCTIYLQPLELGVICTVSACRTWNIDGVCVSTGGNSIAIFCLIWQRWHVFTNQVISASISGHQHRCAINLLVVYAPRCPILS